MKIVEEDSLFDGTWYIQIIYNGYVRQEIKLEEQEHE